MGKAKRNGNHPIVESVIPLLAPIQALPNLLIDLVWDCCSLSCYDEQLNPQSPTQAGEYFLYLGWKATFELQH
jgi:hypothetical protein